MAGIATLVLAILASVCVTSTFAAPQFGRGFSQSQAQAQAQTGGRPFGVPTPFQNNRPGFNGFNRFNQGQGNFGPGGYNQGYYPGGGYQRFPGQGGGSISISKSISISRGGAGGAVSNAGSNASGK